VQFTSSLVLDLGLKIQFLRTGPWFSQIGPWDEKSNRNIVCGAMAGGQRSIPSRGGLGSVGKVQGSDVGSPRVPFQGLEGSEKVLPVRFGGLADLKPWELLLQ
jgi:hypothetical protein